MLLVVVVLVVLWYSRGPTEGCQYPVHGLQVLTKRILLLFFINMKTKVSKQQTTYAVLNESLYQEQWLALSPYTPTYDTILYRQPPHNRALLFYF